MSLFGKLIPLIGGLPSLVMDIERIHAGKSGADKKAAAMELIGHSLGIVEATSPAHAAQINAVAVGVGAAIDGIVAALNAAGLLHRGAPTAAEPSPIPHEAAASASTGE